MFKIVVDKNIVDKPEEIVYSGKNKNVALTVYKDYCVENKNWDVEYWEYDNLKFWRT